MRAWLVAICVIFGIICSSVGFADECAPGYVFSRGVIGCIQEKCPPGSGRLYSERCSCWTSEWGGTPKVTCADEKTGLVTHCLPEGGDCAKTPSTFDPVTGQCVSGFTLNTDKSNCVPVGSPQAAPPASTSSTSSAPPSSGATPAPPSSQTGSSPSPGPSSPQTPEQTCTARPNMQFTSGSCTCKDGFLQDLRRQGCITQEQLSSDCSKVEGATFNAQTKKCECKDPSMFASGFSNSCETRQDFANHVCQTRFEGAVYDESQKKCVCPAGTEKSPEGNRCVKLPSPYGRSCTDDAQCPGEQNRCDPETGKCGCRPPYRSNVDKSGCVTLEEYGNEYCEKKFPGAIFDAANKKCKCPDGWKKSDDGKSCVNPEKDTCDGDDKCPDDKKCDKEAKKCVGIECECGEIKGHACTKFQCCSDDQCSDTQACDTELSHDCVAVSCEGRGIVKNHACDPLGCTTNAGCAANEKCEGGKCAVIDCACGKIENHACTPYECCDTKPCTEETKECDQALHTCVDKADVCKHFEAGVGSINLVLVPDKYTAGDAASFRATTQGIYSTIVATEPFKSRKAKIKVHRVEKFDEDLECRYFKAPGDPDDAAQHRGITCDHGKMWSLAGKCPVNFVIAVVNSAQYGGAAGGVGSAYGYMSKGTQSIGFVHEFGHMLGLEDEYSKGATGEDAWAANAPNCENTADCEKWKDLAGTECVAGCAYDNWKRSATNGDLMKTLANEFFGPVATRHLNTKLR